MYIKVRGDMCVCVCVCASTHHLYVVQDSRHFLNPLYHLHWVFCVLRPPTCLLVQGHLPAHGRVLHLEGPQGTVISSCTHCGHTSGHTLRPHQRPHRQAAPRGSHGEREREREREIERERGIERDRERQRQRENVR